VKETVVESFGLREEPSGLPMTSSTPRTPLNDDETLAQRIQRALEEIMPLSLLGSPLHIQVDNGVVTLGGVVATQFRRAQIVQVTRSVPGVTQVCDNLWV
jgi:osmotically-inducible protein OsmY